MIKIKRDMKKTETTGTEYPYTQTSFNSDGCLTMRKYSNDKNNDEIIIFTSEETQKIVEEVQ